MGVSKEDISLLALDHNTGELPGSEVGKATDHAATGAWQGAKLGLVGGIGALVGSLVKLGIPHAEAEALHTDIQAGGVLLSVKEHGNRDVLQALQAGHPTRVTTV